MSNRFHGGTFLWGLLLTATGAGLLGVGLDFWDLGRIDLRYAAPILVIAIGVSVLFGSLRSGRQDS